MSLEKGVSDINSEKIKNNETRKKIDKIIMMIVLILLCLVLITSNVVSGIFAKYTITKSAKMTLGFERMGIRVDIDVGQSVKDVSTVEGEDTASIVISNLMMKPGYDLSDALKLSVSGSPTEAAVLSVDISIVYNTEDFEVPSANLSKLKLKEDTAFVPLGFTVGTYDSSGTYNKSYAVNPYNSVNNTSAETEAAVEEKIANLTDFTYADNKISKTCAVDEKLSFGEGISAIGFGFDWPKNYSDVQYSDEIGTYIAENKTPTVTIICTISIKQGT